MPVETSSRGNQTKIYKWRPSGDRNAISFGRGRSVSDIAVSVTRSRSSNFSATKRSWGSAVSACAIALPACPEGSKPNRSISAARCVLSTGIASGAVARAALVQSPAVTATPETRPPVVTGMTIRSSWTLRCTVETRFDLSTSGATPPSSNHLIARPTLSSARIGASVTRDRPRRSDRVPSRLIRSCARTVILFLENQRRSAAPSPSGRLSASTDNAASISRQSVTAPRTSAKTAARCISSCRRSRASTRSVSR